MAKETRNAASQELTLEEVHLALREFIHCAVRWQETRADPKLAHPVPGAFKEAATSLSRSAHQRLQRTELIDSAYAYSELHAAVRTYCNTWSPESPAAKQAEAEQEAVAAFCSAARMFPMAVRKRVSPEWGRSLLARVRGRTGDERNSLERSIKAAVGELCEGSLKARLHDWGQITDIARTLGDGVGKIGSAMATPEKREAMDIFAVSASLHEMLLMVFDALEVPDEVKEEALRVLAVSLTRKLHGEDT